MGKAREPLTAGNQYAERARLAKATRVADFLVEHDCADLPTNDTCRDAAAVLMARGVLADHPFSDRSCELVRALLAARGKVLHEVLAGAR